jgi:hypothetical protein
MLMEDNHPTVLFGSIAEQPTEDNGSGFRLSDEFILFILLWLLFAIAVAYIFYTKQPSHL